MQQIDITTTNKAEIIETAVKVLSQGGLMLFPTETTYGAGVDATNQSAVDKLLAYKSRREGKPLSIMVFDAAMASKYVAVNDQARALYAQFLPGPVTVVSKGLGVVARGVESEFGTLGIRIPDYKLMLEISKAFGKPITATSANASGKKSPYSVTDIFSGLSQKQKNLVDLILDAGTLPKNEPSTVIDTTLSAPVVLRSSNREEHIQKNQTYSEHTTATTFTSLSEQETKELAGRVLLKHWSSVEKTGLVIALNGSLGMGKTVFAKGSAQFLQIEETIKSPTYSYIEEYDFTRHSVHGRFYHLDMWKVTDEDMFERLGVAQLLAPNNVVVIEWFSQIAEYIAPYLSDCTLVSVDFAEVAEITDVAGGGSEAGHTNAAEDGNFSDDASESARHQGDSGEHTRIISVTEPK